MSEPVQRQIADNLLRELSDRGQIVEGGWKAYELLTGLSKTSDLQRKECRKAFFFGAQHVFGSLVTMLEPGTTDATDTDIERMKKLDAELRQFLKEMMK